jgi:hypothetical protein
VLALLFLPTALRDARGDEVVHRFDAPVHQSGTSAECGYATGADEKGQRIN